MKSDDEVHLQLAVDLATKAAVTPGCGPFGALVVQDGFVLASGVNRVVIDTDPTAHAEVVAIRAAALELGTHALRDCTLYASCEPCPLCAAAAHWARLDRVVFAASRQDASAAGFDDSLLYAELAGPVEMRSVSTMQVSIPDNTHPFLAWRANEDRSEY
jgi:guanine deaminase